ncbi:flagellar hook capping FlgD N-terminal domain-containing protein [Cypionkella sinensis]|uniref:Basal-body rod modification protein FlgD n=1 Tax=Cypionkella sinensis TaxID=1756043 RepID=A0ABV7J3B1_9RHOB
METSTVTTVQTPANKAANKAAVSADFDTFLKMMTTQMKNQDPLNPIDSSDYAVQLATFSGVEQQTKTNQLLEGLTSQFGVLGMAQLAAWVGQEARSAAPVYLGDDPVTISYQPKTQADRAVLVVKNAQDQVVSREDVSLEGGSYQWLGADAAGNPLPNGIYRLSLENYSGEQQLGDATAVESYAKILEARGGANGPTLVLAGGVEVAATDVTALRVP